MMLLSFKPGQRRATPMENVIVVVVWSSDIVLWNKLGWLQCLLHFSFIISPDALFWLGYKQLPPRSSYLASPCCICPHLALYLAHPTHRTSRVYNCMIHRKNIQSPGKCRPQSLCQGCFKVMHYRDLLAHSRLLTLSRIWRNQPSSVASASDISELLRKAKVSIRKHKLNWSHRLPNYDVRYVTNTLSPKVRSKVSQRPA